MKKTNYSREHLAYLKKLKKKRVTVILSRVLILAVVLGIWELLAQTKAIDPYITSSPSRVAKTIVSLYRDGSLFYHIGITLCETIVGFFIAVIVGYVIAIIFWASDTLHAIVEPYIVVLNSLPKIALGPLIIIWIGTGYEAIIFMTVLVAIILCIMNTFAGFAAVDPTKLTLLKLVIPASLPALMNTLKVAVGLAWIGSIMGEYIVSRAGLGHLINYGGQVMQLDLVMTSTFILCVLTGGMYAIIALMEKLVVKQF